MQEFNSPNIFYLEDTEFDSNYTLSSPITNPKTGAPFFSGTVVVMVQGKYCGYCTEFKPKFQQVADELSPMEFATIQIDGEQPGEQIFKTDALTTILGGPLQGVPYVLKFHQGRPVDAYSGPQEYEALKQWVLS